MSPKAVDVSILGQTYRVKGEADDAYVKDVARYVDGKMREVNDGGRWQPGPCRCPRGVQHRG